MRIDVHHYFHDDPTHVGILQTILTRVNQIHQQGVVMAGKVDELLADLAEANTTTNEIAEDVDTLLSKLAAGGLSPEETAQVQGEIAALKTRLQGVAAKYPPVPPVE